MISPELLHAVKERIRLGVSQEQISAELVSNGYDQSVIDEVYHLAQVELKTPIPPSGSPAAIPVPTPPEVDQSAVPTPPSESGSTSKLTPLPGIGDLLNGSFNYLFSRLDLWAYMSLPLIALAVLQYIFASSGIEFQTESGISAVAETIAHFSLIILFPALCYVIVRSGERRVLFQEGLRWLPNNILTFWWAGLLSFVVVMIGFFVFIIPGIIILGYILFSQMAVAFGEARGSAAVQRSFQLVKDRWWGVVLRSVVVWIVVFFLMLLSGFIFGFILGLTFGEVFDEIILLFAGIVNAAALIVLTHVQYQMYVALRVGREVPQVPQVSRLGSGAGLAIVILVTLAIAVLLSTATNSLNTAQQDAERAAMQMQISNSRLLAEMQFGSTNSYAGVCDDIEVRLENLSNVRCVDDVDSYAVTATAPDGSDAWCTDSTGYSGKGGLDFKRGQCAFSPDKPSVAIPEVTPIDEPADQAQSVQNALQDTTVSALLYDAGPSEDYSDYCEFARESTSLPWLNCSGGVGYWAFAYQEDGGVWWCVDSASLEVKPGILPPGSEQCQRDGVTVPDNFSH